MNNNKPNNHHPESRKSHSQVKKCPQRPYYTPSWLKSLRFFSRLVVVCALGIALFSCIAENGEKSDLTFYSPVLNLTEMGIEDFSDQILTDKGIKKENIYWLILSKNNLASLEQGDFAGFSSLKQLFLVSNQIATIEDSAFADLGSLERLDLQTNNLTTLPLNAFLSTTAVASGATAVSEGYIIETVLIDNNQLTALPSDVLAADFIKNILMDNNNIATVSANSFSALQKLERISLNENDIAGLEANSFANEHALVEIALASNQIATVAAASFGSKLEQLSLAGNKLTAIPAEAMPEENSLTYLDLSGNAIKCISKVDMARFTGLQTLYLEGNEWDTDVADCIQDDALADMEDLLLLSIDIRRDGESEGIPADSDFFKNLRENNLSVFIFERSD